MPRRCCRSGPVRANIPDHLGNASPDTIIVRVTTPAREAKVPSQSAVAMSAALLAPRLLDGRNPPLMNDATRTPPSRFLRSTRRPSHSSDHGVSDNNHATHENLPPLSGWLDAAPPKSRHVLRYGSRPSGPVIPGRTADGHWPESPQLSS